VNILIGKQRYASTSDRQREKLQAQITTYSIRHHSEQALKEEGERLRVLGQSLESRVEVAQDIREVQLDRLVDNYIALVDRVMEAI
jgi:hypothetical protein